MLEVQARPQGRAASFFASDWEGHLRSGRDDASPYEPWSTFPLRGLCRGYIVSLQRATRLYIRSFLPRLICATVSIMDMVPYQEWTVT